VETFTATLPAPSRSSLVPSFFEFILDNSGLAPAFNLVCPQDQPSVHRSEGVTPSERYLGNLCERSFLSLWSYPGVFRDQGQHKGKGDGKELCDLLVTFRNHVIVFSDKHCRFPESQDLQVDWGRWYQKTISRSADQIYGAERWIKNFPKRLFLDRRCTIPFPIDLPDPEKASFHRIVVAHDGSRRCREVLGGSGSMMLDNSVIGGAHLTEPFKIGQIDPDRGYVHVFDDTTLDIVMKTLDTVSDFVAYLERKERFLTGDKTVFAAGEEELLAHYLGHLNSNGEHDFVIKKKVDLILFDEGHWANFVTSPERACQLDVDRVSYSWDSLITKFAFHAMTGTQYYTSGQSLRYQEPMFRLLAGESRTRRRLLAKSLHEVLQRSVSSTSAWESRVMLPSNPGDPHYLFLLVKRPEDIADEDYRRVRLKLLADYCDVVKVKYPSADHIVGIASEAGSEEWRSEDILYIDGSDWTAEDQTRAEEVQRRSGYLSNVRMWKGTEQEYPLDNRRAPRPTISPSRNSACPCGSGKRFKRCHGTPKKK
jgi:hypothetical protein